MKKIILLVVLVTLTFSADKWEYLVGKHQNMKSVGWRGFVFPQAYEGKYDKYRNGMKEYDSPLYPLINSLDKIAEDGWELVSVSVENESLTLYHFKRKVQ